MAKFINNIIGKSLRIVKLTSDEWEFVRTIKIEDKGYTINPFEEDADPWINKIVLDDEPERTIFMFHMNDNGHGNCWIVEV